MTVYSNFITFSTNVASVIIQNQYKDGSVVYGDFIALCEDAEAKSAPVLTLLLLIR